MTRSTGPTVRIKPGKAAPAKQHGSDGREKDPSAVGAKAQSHSEPSGRSKVKDAKPKDGSGK